MSSFQAALDYVLSNEGKITENKNDRGGITNCGISLRFLQSLTPEHLRVYEIFDAPNEETIRNLNNAQISRVYYNEFWIRAPFSEIENQSVANYVFDMAVNMGIAPSIKCVQRAIWATTAVYVPNSDDGILSENTLALLNGLANNIKDALRSERGAHYRQLADQMPNQKEFLRGWYDRTYRAI